MDQARLQGTSSISWRLEFQKADLLGTVLEWAVFDGHFDYTSTCGGRNRCYAGQLNYVAGITRVDYLVKGGLLAELWSTS
jgi:hypothetical protein